MISFPILVTAYVSGFVAPSIVALFALSTQRREAERSRQDELRRVLDTAAHALMLAWRGMQPLGDQWKKGDVLDDAQAADAIQAVDRASEKAQHARDRLAIRLGAGAPAAKSYDLAAAALDDYALTLTPFLHSDSTPPAADTEALDAARTAYLTAVAEFHERARTEGATDTPFQLVKAVTIFAIVSGAFLAGAALWSLHTHHWLRVNGSAVATIAARGTVVPRCDSLTGDGLGRWRCVARPAGHRPQVTFAIVKDDGRVELDGPGTRSAVRCCVDVR